MVGGLGCCESFETRWWVKLFFDVEGGGLCLFSELSLPGLDLGIGEGEREISTIKFTGF